MAFGFMKKISPEYVVEHAIADMKKAGFDGLKPYLTDKAERNVQTILSVSSGVNLITGSNKVAIFFQRLADYDWTVADILKGSDSAKAVLEFAISNGEDEIAGTLQLTLIKEEKEWRIDGVDMPQFTKFTVAVPDAPQA